MNIFVLDLDHSKAAEYMLDRHVVKMPLETAQLLCTAKHLNGFDAPYQPTHLKHPCTIWAARSGSNFKWLKEHGLAICKEYTYRYNKRHKCQDIIESLDSTGICDVGLTTFAQAMPDQYKSPDVVDAYRKYYKHAKSHLFSWKKRSCPAWLL